VICGCSSPLLSLNAAPQLSGILLCVCEELRRQCVGWRFDERYSQTALRSGKQFLSVQINCSQNRRHFNDPKLDFAGFMKFIVCDGDLADNALYHNVMHNSTSILQGIYILHLCLMYTLSILLHAQSWAILFLAEGALVCPASYIHQWRT
jgi:hypothetical protein